MARFGGHLSECWGPIGSYDVIASVVLAPAKRGASVRFLARKPR